MPQWIFVSDKIFCKTAIFILWGKGFHLEVQFLIHKPSPLPFLNSTSGHIPSADTDSPPGGTVSLPVSSLRALCSPESMVNFQESAWSAQVCTCWSSTWTWQGNPLIKLNYENLQSLVPITVSFPWKRVKLGLLHQHQAHFALESASFNHSKYFARPLPLPSPPLTSHSPPSLHLHCSSHCAPTRPGAQYNVVEVRSALVHTPCTGWVLHLHLLASQHNTDDKWTFHIISCIFFDLVIPQSLTWQSTKMCSFIWFSTSGKIAFMT